MTLSTEAIAHNVADVRAQIAACAGAAGRPVEAITLLAVSKGQPPSVLREGYAAGLTAFGESYLQEALPKLDALQDLPLTWHYIGRVQANKTRPIAERFAWVHGVDRLKVAERLSQQRPYHAPPLNVCLQVNLGAEPGKAGTAVEALPALAADVAVLPRLTLRGLMCLPPQEDDPAAAKHWFAALAAQFRGLKETVAPGLDTLSMGMSADFEAAILAGATIVRIGTRLFGPRQASPQ
jgi:pyridoxal phosphate enzyme (YggS family)